MEDLDRLSLVARVQRELEASLGVSEEALAEFFIENAKQHEREGADAFAAAMKEQDESIPASLCKTIFGLVVSMGKAGKGPAGGAAAADGGGANNGTSRREGVSEMAKQLPGLARPDELRPIAVGEGRDSATEKKLRELRAQLDRSGGGRSMSSTGAGKGASASGGTHADKSRFKRGSEREPEYGKIYSGKVRNIKDFGCFVELPEFPSRDTRSGNIEGLVRTQHVARDMRNRSAHDVVRSGDEVLVKVISQPRTKLLLSMADVDQRSGADLAGPPAMSSSSSEATSTLGTASARELPGIVQRKRKLKHSEEELWEIRQLVNSGALNKDAYPHYDEERGAMDFEETEEELEVELNEAEPAFLRGQTEMAASIGQVKIVKNPEGSMQRAAENQTAIAKERRELKRAQEQTELNAVPRNMSRAWLDPMADDRERTLAGDLRGITLPGREVPEWKKQAFGNNASFGYITDKSIQEQRESLPIYQLKTTLCEAFMQNQILVVVGETGSGKTTQMTQYLAEMGFTKRGIVGCTQPRRVAAVSVAKRVAEEVGCRVGQEVGYTIRFEDCTGPETAIKYMTDGMLMREMLMDGDLKRYSCIMLDEAHERNVSTDVLFALLKKLVQRRKDFRLIVTSATLDAEKFSQYFLDAKIFTIPGRTFPVDIMYAKEAENDYVDAALVTVMQIHLNEGEGDILLFLTGQEEIDTACEVLYQRMQRLGRSAPPLIILPAYGSLPSEMQSRIFEPAPRGSRKLIVATNIAEASITVDGIHYVVDPGMSKINAYNPKLGMDSLVVTPISQASARQRAGRAGRTGPGKCFRLYTELAYKTEMLPTNVPEIQRTNLGNVVLQLKSMGVNDLLSFDFMDPPPAQTLVAALEKLYALGALDEEGLLTKMGRKMAAFPLDPILSKTLISSVELGCAEEVVTIVAMLSVENIFFRPKEKQAQADQKKARFHQPEGDHLTMLAVYESWKRAGFSKAWCVDQFVQTRSIQRAQDIRQQLVGILGRYRMPIESCGRKFKAVQMAIASGFFMHAAKRDPTEGYRTLVEGQPVFIHPGSALFQRNPEVVIYHELVLTSKEYMRQVMVIDPKTLLEVAPNFYRSADPNKLTRRKKRERIEPLYDPRDEGNQLWRLSRRRG
ncbi:ATP-dependent RNA helicase DHX8 [Hondaea fermentalgiana]|uniref:RNA helicase n=1 Tax=Hondaea fermentalgiana TaxID=2315210 RepID=A0A2R5GVQ6_9STRA|nr:ATP-dependent RNA helicase DHX8 [Hondaea fermentalgiana]|eukprot:GBG34409.1 ATP-dependent RNA helicase DHX8 [Hondaea fermentalgiana]